MRFPEPAGVGETQLYRPATDGFIRDIDTTLRQQVFDIPKAQQKAATQPDSLLDDLGWKTVAAIGRIALLHLIALDADA